METKTKNNSLSVLTILIIVLGLITSLTGLFYIDNGTPYDVINQYGETIKINGNGLYAHDSFFMAPIFRGTDFTILIMAIPMLLIAFFVDLRKKSIKSRMFLISVIAVFTYYSTSISFGVTYNILHLVYIALFSTSFFGLIVSIKSIDKLALEEQFSVKLPYRGFHIFLGLSGFALIAAWIPDILVSIDSGRPLALIEVYTTSVTNVLDIGIIGPTALLSIYLLKRRNALGYILLSITLTLCIVIGVMLPVQTLFQDAAGIYLPVPVLISKVTSFVILALFALYFNIRLYRTQKNTN